MDKKQQVLSSLLVQQKKNNCRADIKLEKVKWTGGFYIQHQNIYTFNIVFACAPVCLHMSCPH